jgi:hypothetical protein
MSTTDKKSKVKVNKLAVNKETVKELSDSEAKKVQGGGSNNINCATAGQAQRFTCVDCGGGLKVR